jgi:hypothetical protein
MAIWVEIFLSILAGCATVMLALMLFVLRDLRDRIVRLEDYVIGNPPTRSHYRGGLGTIRSNA